MAKTTEEIIENQEDTIIGPSVKIKGDLDSEGNIRIEGQVTGKISSRQGVFIQKGAKLVADIIGNEVSIAGEVQGKLSAFGLLILQSTANVSGEITSPVLRVEDGAQFSGQCAMNSSN